MTREEFLDHIDLIMGGTSNPKRAYLEALYDEITKPLMRRSIYEPRFKIGDWIVDDCDYVWKIEEILGQCYRLEADDGAESLPTIDCIDNTSHLWTIADANDGDILVTSDESIFIYAGSTDKYAKFHLALTKYGELNIEGGNWENINAVHPATQEQRETLFMAIHEAGYEWDTEKGRTKKIEPKKLDADKVIEWLRQNICTACYDEPDVTLSQRINKFKKDFGL